MTNLIQFPHHRCKPPKDCIPLDLLCYAVYDAYTKSNYHHWLIPNEGLGNYDNLVAILNAQDKDLGTGAKDKLHQLLEQCTLQEIVDYTRQLETHYGEI